MKVRCIGNKGTYLFKKTLDTGYDINTDFSLLNLESIYIVYGICILKNGTILYLISENIKYPLWYPIELFTIHDHLLPLEWYYNFLGYDYHINAIWGYYELVIDKNHNDELMERESQAIEIFSKRKQELDEYENLNKFLKKTPINFKINKFFFKILMTASLLASLKIILKFILILDF